MARCSLPPNCCNLWRAALETDFIVVKVFKCHSDDQGHDYYFRQLRDMKMTINVEDMREDDWMEYDWMEYVKLCGWSLARAHAPTGDAAQIAGYLGSSDQFDVAIAKFAAAYADQTENDHEVFVKAIRGGRIKASKSAAS